MVGLTLTLQTNSPSQQPAAERVSTCNADVLDISLGGLCLLLSAPLPAQLENPGQQLQVNFNQPVLVAGEGERWIVKAELRWINHHSAGVSTIGLAFTTPLAQLPELKRR